MTEPPRDSAKRMARPQLAFNIAALAMLSVICVAFIVMPRYNFEYLLAKVVRLEAQSARLEAGFEKLNILSGENEHRRAAVLGQIDQIATNLRKQDQDLVAFMEVLAQTIRRADDLAARLLTVEQGPPGSANRGTVFGRTDVEEPISTSSSLARASATLEEHVDSDFKDDMTRLTPRKIAEMTFEGFWDHLRRGEVFAGAGVGLGEGIEAEGFTRLRQLFAAYQSCSGVIDLSEQLLTQELVEKATRSGDYFEEGKETEGSHTVRPPREGGTVYVKTLSDGRRRVFRFSSEDNPEYSGLDQLRNRALKALLISVRSTVGH